MKLYTAEKSEKQILNKIKEALDNLEGLNLSNTLKAEAILSNIKTLQVNKVEELQHD